MNYSLDIIHENKTLITPQKKKKKKKTTKSMFFETESFTNVEGHLSLYGTGVK